MFVDQATIAPYLDRAQIVSRVAPDQVAFADVRTWAEPVTSMITRYLVDELGARFGPDRVLETPARRDLAPDFRLAIDVQRFDGDQAGIMVLDARWTLLAGPDERFARHRSRANRRAGGRSGVVGCARGGAGPCPVGAFSHELAEAIKASPRTS